MANGAYKYRGNIADTNFHHHNFVEAGIGYYTDVGKDYILEVYGGMGTGFSRNVKYVYTPFSATAPNETYSYKSHSGLYNRYFVQFDIGHRCDQIGSVGLVVRPTFVQLYQFNKKPVQSNGLILEGGAFVRLGYQYVKFQAQGGLSLGITPMRGGGYPFIFSVGLHFNLNSKFM